jgi:hypothetical protein
MSGESKLMTRQEAVERFRSGVPSLDSRPKSGLENALRMRSIAKVKLGIAVTAYQDLTNKYAVCINKYGEYLDWTAGHFDNDGVPEDGHVSKSIDTNTAGMQIKDPKSLFHFNNALEEKVQGMDRNDVPPEFADFIDLGFALKNELTRHAMALVSIVGESWDGLEELLFPDGETATTLRLLRYDGYPTKDENGKMIVERNAQVAKPHFDRGTATIQAYASDPGFWRQPYSRRGARYKKYYPPHGPDQSQFFFGEGFRAVYGSQENPIKPLYHGVDRRFEEGADYVYPRTAVILFVDTPRVNLDIKSIETQPERIDILNLDT